MAVIYILCLQAQTLAKKQSIFKVFFITQLGHRPVVPNQGAICNAQGCRELMRFLIYH